MKIQMYVLWVFYMGYVIVFFCLPPFPAHLSYPLYVHLYLLLWYMYMYMQCIYMHNSIWLHVCVNMHNHIFISELDLSRFLSIMYNFIYRFGMHFSYFHFTCTHTHTQWIFYLVHILSLFFFWAYTYALLVVFVFERYGGWWYLVPFGSLYHSFSSCFFCVYGETICVKYHFIYLCVCVYMYMCVYIYLYILNVSIKTEALCSDIYRNYMYVYLENLLITQTLSQGVYVYVCVCVYSYIYVIVTYIYIHTYA